MPLPFDPLAPWVGDPRATPPSPPFVGNRPVPPQAPPATPYPGLPEMLFNGGWQPSSPNSPYYQAALFAAQQRQQPPPAWPEYPLPPERWLKYPPPPPSAAVSPYMEELQRLVAAARVAGQVREPAGAFMDTGSAPGAPVATLPPGGPPSASPAPTAPANTVQWPEPPPSSARDMSRAPGVPPPAPTGLNAPGTPQQNEAADKDALGGMDMTLKRMGINPFSPGGVQYGSMADDLRNAYYILAGAKNSGASPRGVTDPSALLGFMEGYVRTMQGTGPEARADIARQRGLLKAQVTAGLTLPSSDMYDYIKKSMTDEGRGNPNNQYAVKWLWDTIIHPALAVGNTGSLTMRAKEAQYNQLYRAFRAYTAENPNQITFQDYLGQSGFGVE